MTKGCIHCLGATAQARVLPYATQMGESNYHPQSNVGTGEKAKGLPSLWLSDRHSH